MGARHLGPDQLEGYLTDSLEGEPRELAESHLRGCAACRTLLEATRAGREVTAPHRESIHATVRVPTILQLGGGGSMATDPALQPHQLRFNASPAPDEVTASGPPSAEAAKRVSRYLLIEMAGRGAMGEVYVAYDPQLDRKVALKLLRSEVAREGTVSHARLLREAQAMARLTHPNVVSVHDAGVWGQQVYLVMEYVAGPTLAAWTVEDGKAWREVLAMYVAAGRGLAAAHAAGLVHRDFKPQNVLIAPDGRPKVTDFGLAHLDDHAGAVEGRAARSPRRALTAEGTLIGTPAYMAPEIFQGKAADARSDQFGFCAALYESLYGERPLLGDDVGTIAASIARGELRPPPRGGPVPTWVGDAILRGLALDPAQRYPSLELLLHELERDPSRARRRLVQRLGLGLVALGIAGAAGWTIHRDRTRCDREAQAALPAWTVPSGAAGTLDAPLQAYRDGWVAQHRQICEEVRAGALSAETGTLRTRCLESQKLRVGAALQLLGAAEGVPTSRLLNRLEGSWSSAGCERLESPRHEPQAEQARFAAELSRVEALADSGNPERARKAALELEETAKAAGARSVQAAAMLQRVELRLVSGKDLEEAVALSKQAALLAESAGDDQLAASAHADELKTLALFLDRYQEAERIVPEVRAAVERAGNPAPQVATMDRSLGYLALARNDRSAAAHFEHALDAIRSAYGPETSLAAPLLNDVAEAKIRLERDPAAAAHAFLDASVLLKPVGQVEQTNILIFEVNAISSLMLAATPAEAEAVSRQARPIAETIAATAPLDASAYYLNAADVELATNRPADADRDLARAEALFRRADPTPDLLQSLELLRAREVLAKGDAVAAATHAERAVKLGSEPGSDEDALALAQAVLARALESSDRARARHLASTALTHFRAAPMPLFAQESRQLEALLARTN